MKLTLEVLCFPTLYYYYYYFYLFQHDSHCLKAKKKAGQSLVSLGSYSLEDREGKREARGEISKCSVSRVH